VLRFRRAGSDAFMRSAGPRNIAAGCVGLIPTWTSCLETAIGGRSLRIPRARYRRSIRSCRIWQAAQRSRALRVVFRFARRLRLEISSLLAELRRVAQQKRRALRMPLWQTWKRRSSPKAASPVAAKKYGSPAGFLPACSPQDFDGLSRKGICGNSGASPEK